MPHTSCSSFSGVISLKQTTKKYHQNKTRPTSHVPRRRLSTHLICAFNGAWDRDLDEKTWISWGKPPGKPPNPEEKKGREVAFPYATHGAGIFTYKTGWFWTRANVGIHIPAPWSIWDFKQNMLWPFCGFYKSLMQLILKVPQFSPMTRSD